MTVRGRSWFLSFLLVVTSSALWADSHARIVRLSYVEGDVQMDRRDDKGFQRAFSNMPVIEGARIWTRNDARAEIEMEDGSTLRLTPDTILEFREMRLRGDGSRSTLIDVQQGTLYVDNKSKNDDLRLIYNNSQQISPLKASHFRMELDQNQMKLSMFRGNVEVIKDNGERVEVRKDETLNIDFTDPSRYYLAKGIDEGAFDSWDQERNDDRAQAAQKQYVSGYVSSYQYGWNDLYRYGSWSYVPGYGSLWSPYGVTAGWDPFWYGRWSYYPVYGWTWISPYSWGWLPYRYGSWIHFGGRGWLWSPGRVHNNWVSVTTVINPPPTYVRPVRPGRPGVSNPVVVTVNNGPGWDVNRGVRPVDDVPVVRPGRATRDTGGLAGGAVSGGGIAATSPATSVSGAGNLDMSGQDRARPHRDTNVIDNDVLQQRGGSSTPAASGDVAVDRSGRGTRDTGSQGTPAATTPAAVAPADSGAPGSIGTDRPSRSVRTTIVDDTVDAVPRNSGQVDSGRSRPSRGLELTGSPDANRGSRTTTVQPSYSQPAPSAPAATPRSERPSRDYGTQPSQPAQPTQPAPAPRMDRPSRDSAPAPSQPASPPPSAPRTERPSRDTGPPRTDLSPSSSYRYSSPSGYGGAPRSSGPRSSGSGHSFSSPRSSYSGGFRSGGSSHQSFGRGGGHGGRTR